MESLVNSDYIDEVTPNIIVWHGFTNSLITRETRFTIFLKQSLSQGFSKLDGVGPVDNRPSND